MESPANCLLFDIETNENGETYALGAFSKGDAFITPQDWKVDQEQLAEFVLGRISSPTTVCNWLD